MNHTYIRSFAAVLLLLLFPAVGLAGSFKDIPDTSPYREATDYLKEKGIIGGYKDGTFQPNKALNRVEALKILFESVGQTISDVSGRETVGYKDVQKGQWYVKYVKKAVENGIAAGDLISKTFRPTQNVKLAEALKMAWNIYSKDVYKVSDRFKKDVVLPRDVKETDWFASYVKEALALGVINKDKNGNINPGAALSRGQFADIIYKFLIVKETSSPFAGIAQIATGKIKGDSNGKIPYAPVDAQNVAVKKISKNGGVVKTKLSSGVTMFVILPKGSVIQNATVSILPYTKMPTQKTHPALSNAFGYGAQVIISSVQMGIPAYVVFDVTGGKASASAAKKFKYYNRCDPKMRWFDPLICAKLNKVPVDKIVDKNYAVVTPIHTEQYKHIVFTRPTLPIGIDGLIVAEVKGGDVYIPQKLDKDLAETLAKLTLGGNYSNDSDLMESAALALEWDISIPDKLDLLAFKIAGESFMQSKKNITTAQKLLKKYAPMEGEDAENILADLKQETENEARALFVDARMEAKGAYSSLTSEAAVVTGDLSKSGTSGGNDALADMQNDLGPTDIQDAVDSGDATPAEGLDGIDASGIANDSNSSFNSSALGQTASNLIDGVLNDPNATIEDCLHAAEVAQAFGLEDEADKAIEKAKKLLEDLLNDDLTQGELLDAAAMAQALGADEMAGNALDRYKTAKPDEPCDLVNKNLSNYGINTCDKKK